jgi:hypothetical protein
MVSLRQVVVIGSLGISSFACSQRDLTDGAGSRRAAGNVPAGPAQNGSGEVSSPADVPPSCSAYDGIMAALGELTADCRGKLDPNDYVIGADGRLATNFDSCPADPTNPQRLLRIKQLLSVQHASNLPDVVRCTAGRFQSLKAKFAAKNIDRCPTWSNKHVLNPAKTPNDIRPTSVDIEPLAHLLPALEDDREVQLESWAPPPELNALKIKSTYTVTLEPGSTQSCGTPVECASTCAEVFPGFVISSVPGAISADDPDHTILVDPDSWWSEEVYSVTNPDPYNLNLAFYHQMGFATPLPGETYGALARWNPCNATVVSTDPATGKPYTLPLIATTPTSIASPQITTDCQSEKCNYWAGGSVWNPTYFKTKLQRWCADPTGVDQSTCVSYCGPKPPPAPLP